MTIPQLADSHHHYEGYDCWSVKLTWFATVQRSDLQITSLRSYPSLKRSRQTSQLIRGFVFLSTIFADFWQFFWWFFLTDWPSTPFLSVLKKVTANISTDKGQNLAQDPFSNFEFVKYQSTLFFLKSYELQLLFSTISVLKRAKANI